MRKRLLLAFIAAMGAASTFAYNVGDYIYTRTGKFKVIGTNLIADGVNSFTTMGGTQLNPDTIKVISEGADLEDSPNGDPYLMVAAGNVKSSCTALSEIPSKLCANFKTIVPVSANTRYVAMYKAKSLNTSTVSTQYYTGRNMNYQNIAFRTDDALDVTGITTYSDWITYTADEGWVEMAYEVVPEEAGFLHFWFFNLVSGDCFGDFGVYEVEPVGDDRLVRDFIDEINTYLAIPGLDKDADSREVLVNEILPVLESFLENPDTPTSDITDFIMGMTQDEDSPIKAFLDANTVDVSKYFQNFDFNDLSAASKTVAAGWTSSIGTDNWGLEAATGTSYGSFTTTHVKNELSSTSTVMNASSYSQSVDLPSGKFLYIVKAQAYRYFADGSGSSNNHYIPDYSTPVEGVKYFINEDSVTMDVKTTKPTTFVHVWDVATDGIKNLGFYFPGAIAGLGLDGVGQNISGDGMYRFDNVEIRMIGVDESYIAEYFYGANVKIALDELQAAVDAIEAKKNSGSYAFGITEITAALDAAKNAIATLNAPSEENLAALKEALSELLVAESAFETINKEYLTLGNDIAISKEELQDEKRPNAKDAFSAAINVAETYYLAQTETSRDSLVLVQTDSTLLVEREKYLIANASYERPAELILVNSSFQAMNARGWDEDGGASTPGKSNWKFSAMSDFEGGYCAYFNRGYSATDYKWAWQEVEIPGPGVYEFKAQVVCNNSSWASTLSYEEANTNTWLFANTDSVMVYTQGLGDKSQNYPGNVEWFSVTVKVSDVNTLTTPGSLRVGIERPIGNTIQGGLIYFGSCHLLYYGSIDAYETGITDVEKIPAMTGDIYSISGAKVRSNATSLSGLPKGIYIMNGKKYVVK